MYEFGNGAWGNIGQANGDAIGHDDFGRGVGRVNDVDGNEGSPGGCFDVLRLLSVFFEPTVKAMNGATDFLSDLGDGSVRMNDTGDCVLSNFDAVTNAGHGEGTKSHHVLMDGGDYPD